MNGTVLAGSLPPGDATPDDMTRVLRRVAAAVANYRTLRAVHPSGIVLELAPVKSLSTGELMIEAERAMDAAGIEYRRHGIEFTPSPLGRSLTAAEVLSWLAGTHATFMAPEVGA